MLRVKSFDISNDEGMNELLDKYPLSSGGEILVSNGSILIPYEDGEPANNSQRVIAHKKEVLELAEKRKTLQLQNSVTEAQIAEAEAQKTKAESEYGDFDGLDKKKDAGRIKEIKTKNDAIKKRVDAIDGATQQLETTIRMNEAEMGRLEFEMDAHRKMIGMLGSGVSAAEEE